MSNHFDVGQKALVRAVNSAVINISGRQRMLSQRATTYALRLVLQPEAAVRQELLNVVNLMARSHRGLLHGDPDLHLPGKVSPKMHTIYFDAPHSLDTQIRDFIATARELTALSDAELSIDHPKFQLLLKAGAERLLYSLDQAVYQYQLEAEAEAQAIDAHQEQLYHQAQQAYAQAQEQAQSLQSALDQLKRVQQQLIHTEKMSSLGQLVAGIAHEINNPLSFIHGNLRYLEDYAQTLLNLFHYSSERSTTPLNAQLQDELTFIRHDLPRLLNSMRSGSERIRTIVEGLRNFSRLDEAIAIKTVDLCESLENTLLVLAYRLQDTRWHQSIAIQRHYMNSQVWAACYPGQLNQVFLHLLNNAIDALHRIAPDRDPLWQPAIQLRVQSRADQTVEIQIQDNGGGIPENIQRRIFDPFFTTKSVGTGKGLGLSISHQIVTEYHQGQLTFVSSPEGTTFTIALPQPLKPQPSPNSLAVHFTHSEQMATFSE